MRLKNLADWPVAPKKPHSITIHGDTRVDNYYWLNERENPEVVDYLLKENEYTKKVMEPLNEFQEKLFAEMKSRIKETDMSVPYAIDGWYFYSRFEEGKEYPIYCRKKGNLEATEEVMIDVNELAKGSEYFHVTGLSLSPNKRYLAYGVDTLSRRVYTIHFKDLHTGEIFPFTLENTDGGGCWAADNKTFFYTKKDEETLREYQVWKYEFGTEGSEGELVFEEKDELFSCGVFKSKSRDYIFISSSSTTSTEYQYLKSTKPQERFQLFSKRQADFEYGVEHMGDYFYMITNWEATNFRLMKTDLLSTDYQSWEEVLAHREGVLLEDLELFHDYMVLEERIEGIVNIRVKSLSTDVDYYIDFGEKAYLAFTSVNPDFGTEILRVGYTSLTTPSSVYDYNMRTKSKTLLKQQEVQGDFDSSNYKSERLYATARDGAQVPISLVYHKNTKIDGQAPLMLYGYGSYGIVIDPSFSSLRLSLLDRGFVYAIAHIRGSETKGRHWYEDGKFLAKKNTFYDFIDSAKWLIENQYANKDYLFAKGGSAGGLLMGSIMNMAPEIWKGVVAHVPFVDVVTTMLDESIPLTVGEFEEWGNPKEEEYYHYIKSYSPVDNVEAKNYPNLLVMTGFHDSQVQYWEPAKWVAKLRDVKTDNNLLLLQTEMDYGHGGASGRFESLKEDAMEYAFVLDLAEIEA